MRAALLSLAAAALSKGASGETYLQESFDKGWKDRWVIGKPKSDSEMGEWKWTSGKWYADKADKGLQTGDDARFYSATSALTKEFDNTGKTLVLQFSVKHEQSIDCGGAYIKLVPPGVDRSKFGGDTDYRIMFGPDICGYSTRKTHVIFNYKGKNHLVKRDVRVETDQLTHMYTLIVRPDNTYEVRIDGAKVQDGSLLSDFDMLPPKTITDPEAKKPTDWVDDAKIPDPTDSKPDGWDDVPARIPDPAATKPSDWNEEEDGEWEPPTIANPDYKGEWSPRMIDNPAYKGAWVAPSIDNPEFKDDPELYARCNPCGMVGFELWQVKAGTIFDDIIVTDSVEEAESFAKSTFFAKKADEKRMFDQVQEDKRKKEEEERKQRQEEEDKKKKEKEADSASASASADDDADDDDDADESSAKDEL